MFTGLGCRGVGSRVWGVWGLRVERSGGYMECYGE